MSLRRYFDTGRDPADVARLAETAKETFERYRRAKGEEVEGLGHQLDFDYARYYDAVLKYDLSGTDRRDALMALRGHADHLTEEEKLDLQNLPKETPGGEARG